MFTNKTWLINHNDSRFFKKILIKECEIVIYVFKEVSQWDYSLNGIILLIKESNVPFRIFVM